jgi:hypothetical protein
LAGYDLKGRKLWEKAAGDYLAKLEQGLPKGLATGATPDRFTFACVDAGAGARAGKLAFDVGVSAGKMGADGYVISESRADYVVRMQVSAQTGEFEWVGKVENGKSWLVLGRNPVAPVHRDVVTGEDYQLTSDIGFVFPAGGRGQVLYDDKPIVWKGQPVVNGFDFAWFFPQAE